MKQKALLIISTCFFLHISLASALPNDYIAFFKFDGSALDETGSYDGVESGVFSYTSGIFGSAISFSNGSVTATDITELNGANEFTIAGWFNDNNLLTHNRYFHKGDSLNNDISAATFGGELYVEVGNGANTFARWTQYSSEIAHNEWYHAAFIFNGSAATNAEKIKLFINGQQKPLVFSGTFPASTANLAGFNFTVSKPDISWNGEVDEFLIYARALSQSDIAQIIEEQTEKMMRIPVQTCQGEGDFYAYHTNPFQELNTSFVTQHDELYIFTRPDYIANVNVALNNVPVSKTTVVDLVSPFRVRVYKVETTPGDVVAISDGSVKDSRAIQGFLTQDSAQPAFTIDAFNIVFDDALSDTLHLVPGIYDFIIFDKYSRDPPGFDPDNRRLSVSITDGVTVFSKNYTKPYPFPVEGAVIDSYTVALEDDYDLSIDTEDSVYWFLLECPEPPPQCPDADNDGVCDEDDTCPNSRPGEPVDDEGCDIFEFCGRFSCGPDCFSADWMNNEPREEYPRDCTVVIKATQGGPLPFCVPTEFSQMCAG